MRNNIHSTTLFLLAFFSVTTAFTSPLVIVKHTHSTTRATTFKNNERQSSSSSLILKAAESEVSFKGDLNGENVRVGIIRTRWNQQAVDRLVTAAKETLLEDCNVTESNIFVTEVPGSFELPLAASYLARSNTVDAIICIGVLIKGDTFHFEYIADAVSKGLMNVGLSTMLPVVFGVLTCNTEQQVNDRSSDDNNHGRDWAKTAVEMALLRNQALGQEASKLGKMGFTDNSLKTKKGSERPGFF